MGKDRPLINIANEISDNVDKIERLYNNTKIAIRFLLHRVDQVQGRELIKIDQAAEMLEVSERTVQRMADRGEIFRYNADGSRKLNDRSTATYYDFTELFLHIHNPDQ